MGNIYAYGRLAPDDSKEEFLTAVAEMQVPEGNVYADHRNKKRRTFPEYAKLLKKLEHGDLLYISGLSSLGESYAEVKEQWRVLTKEKKADVIVLDMPTKEKGFSFVICSGLLHEVEDSLSFLKQIAAICVKDTIVHINVPNANRLHTSRCT